MADTDPGDLKNDGEPMVAQQLGYEPRDIDAAGVLWATVAIVLLAVLSAVAMYGMLGQWAVPAVSRRGVVRPHEQVRALSEDKPLDQRTHRREQEAGEQQVLSTYGWVDRQAGIARIPVSRAIQLMGERGNFNLFQETDENEPPQ